MAVERDGGCQCGYVRYRISGDPLGLTVCHCTECQRQSGSAFGMTLAVASDSFRLVSGELASFQVTCDSGRIKTCRFCPRCGTRITHQISAPALGVKAGTLDDTSWLAPGTHYWTKRKQPWFALPAGTHCIEDDG